MRCLRRRRHRHGLRTVDTRLNGLSDRGRRHGRRDERRLAHGLRRCGRRCGRRHRRRRRGRGVPWRKQREWVDVGVVRHANPKMHVRDGMLRSPGQARPGDRVAFLHDCAALHEQRAEVRERGLVAARGLDRDSPAVRRDGPGERHLTRCRRTHRHGVAESEVDATVLAARIRVFADGEGTQDVTVRRPGPCLRGRCHRKRPRHRHEQHRGGSGCPKEKHGSTVAAGRPVHPSI
jgi:hypothetical protein